MHIFRALIFVTLAQVGLLLASALPAYAGEASQNKAVPDAPALPDSSSKKPSGKTVKHLPPTEILTEEERQLLKEGEMSQGLYIASGILGTIPGLGIGHGMQGRWLEKGWIFTLSEGIGLGVAGAGFALAAEGAGMCVAGIIIFPLAPALCGVGSSYSSAGSAMMMIGGLVYLGFHIWETYDVWAAPHIYDEKVRAARRKMEQGKVQFFLSPLDQGAALAMRWTF